MRRNLFDCISSLFFLSFIENDSILCMFTKNRRGRFMNKQMLDILRFIFEEGFINQRDLSIKTNYSLGLVNKLLKKMIELELVDVNYSITNKGNNLIQESKPKRAIILAAGSGIRMAPLSFEMPKGLMEVKGEVLIERIIRQLNAVGIKEIYVVVGFMKEQFEYLIDDFGVVLVTNSKYQKRNNLYSLSLLKEKIDNTYIIPCDIYCRENPFNVNEVYSWYMVSDELVDDYAVKVTRNYEIIMENTQAGNQMIGISYISSDVADKVSQNLSLLCDNPKYFHSFWEEALIEKNKMIVSARVVNKNKYIEINTYEQLREIDSDSNSLNTDAIKIIENVFNTTRENIQDIQVLKKGMTNRSFIFKCKDKKYIMRIPGEGTDNLINRSQEYEVYQILKGKNISDEIIYMNPENGYKITRFISNCRNCNSLNTEDLIKCMRKLKEFHDSDNKVSHTFNLYEKIEYYQSLWLSNKSVYRDYEKVKKNVLSLKAFIESFELKHCLTHIDAVPDNFLIYEDEFGDEHVRLIDWEYAAMQDPHVDIAMFCIYALYDRKQVDQLIDIYFENACDELTRIKIYAYISICGLLWSNWCEYKRDLGVEFGEYSIRQYRYAKEYYKIVKDFLGKARYKWQQ